jgi:predicted O-linked N-acetylglucosamine transferase (SPINDLY family)
MQLIKISFRKQKTMSKSVEFKFQAKVSALFNQGFDCHKHGQLNQAWQFYQQVLQLQPEHFDALYMLGLIASDNQNLELTVDLMGKVIKLNDKHADALYNHGVALQKLNRLEEAVISFDKVIELNPYDYEALFSRGNALHELNFFDKALDNYIQTLKIKPDYAKAYYACGLTYQKLKRLSEALVSYGRAIKIDSNYFNAYNNRGVVLNDLNRFVEALHDLDKAIELNPFDPEAWCNRGVTLQELNRLEESIACYDRAIELEPEYADAYFQIGFTYQKFKYFEEALASYDKAIKINPNNAKFYSNRGIIFYELNQIEFAITDYNKAIILNSDFAEVFYNRGNALRELKNLDDALASFVRAIEINPDYTQAYSNRGNVLKDLNRFDEALASFDRAIEISPYISHAYSNRGNVLQDLNRLDDALASYDQAIEINPNYAEAYSNRGSALRDLKRLDEALVNYNKAYELKPDHEYLLGNILHTKMHVCDWHDFQAIIEKLFLSISEGKKSSLSFPVLALSDSLSIQRKVAEKWIKDKHPLNTSLGIFSKTPRKEKIKIGYYSADFREHPVSYLTVEFFELHNKNQFELIAFYSGAPDSSSIQYRITSAFDKFINIKLKSDQEIAELSRVMGIDIAVDLTGSTANERVGIFAYRAAPIQISYIGYLGTIGAEYYDYLIADKTIIPAKNQKFYTEKILYLPSYQVNDSKRLIADKVFKKADLNLPKNGFVFCCFNHNYKILPTTFDGWMKILNAVPDSVLFLYATNKWAEANLKIEAEKRGVSQNRIIFGSWIERSEYLARYKVADLFLDTLPYNAGTTASDALWAGLPVLTCMGESFASRVAASLLNAIELPELITTTQAEYEARAIELGNNPAKLKAIKDKLERNRLTTALFDTPRFTKHIEAAFTQMYERYQADLPPDHIYIED